MCRVDSTVRRRAALCAVWAAPCGAARRRADAVRTMRRAGTAVRRHVSPCGAVCAVRAVWQRGAPCGKGAPCGVPCGMPCGV
eukprot:gene12478-biopygen7584